MADHLSDEEQLQLLKNWWKENGSSLVIAVLVGLVAYFGFQYWQSYQNQQALGASAIYSELLQSLDEQTIGEVDEEKRSTVTYLAEQLKDNYSGSVYAVNAQLYVAKLAVDNNDLDTAQSALEWAHDQAHEAFEPLITLRLARVYYAQEALDKALELLDIDADEMNNPRFVSLYAELKGDVLAAKEDWAGALNAYKEAQNTLGETASFRNRLLPIKIANLPQ